MLKLVFAAVFLAVPALAVISQAASPIIADGAPVEKVGSGYGFTERCTADKDGNVFFTDQNHDPGGQILRWSAEDNKITVWMEPTGRANGQRFAPNGGIYMTDPYYHRPWWGPEHATPQQDKRAVYYLSPDGKTLTRVIDDFRMPNGIGGTPDGKILYVSDIGDRKTWKYDVQEDGSLKNKTLFCNVGSDGMTMDNQGNVYLTSGGIQVYDKNGNKIEQIPAPENQQPANVAIGGKEHNILFMAARTSVYTLKLKVKGLDQKP